MRILVANKKDWTHPERSGAERHLQETLPRLSDSGHEVHLISARYPGAARRETLDGVVVHRFGHPGRTNEIYILTAGQVLFNRMILSLDPDVICTVNSMMPWVPLSMRGRHLNVIHHLSGTAVFGKLDTPYNILGYLAERLGVVLARHRRVMTVSPATTHDLVSRGVPPDRITEIRNGVDTNRYRPGEPADEPTVLYLGRLEYNKGADLLPRIDSAIRHHHPGAYHLNIAGTGRREREVETFADSHTHVRFHGYVSEETKIDLLQDAWVVVVPSRREGWGLVVSEANAAATPVVGFASGGLTHAIQDGETGVLIPADPTPAASAGRLGRTVADLLRDTERRESLGANARSFARSLDWEQTTQELETLLSSLSK